MRQTVKSVLRRHDHIVIEANNGAEAYNLFTKQKFDLVVTDYVMPFLNGDELAQRIRRLAPEQPILMITGTTSRSGPRNPVNSVLQKPFDSSSFEQEVERLLALYETISEFKSAN